MFPNLRKKYKALPQMSVILFKQKKMRSQTISRQISLITLQLPKVIIIKENRHYNFKYLGGNRCHEDESYQSKVALILHSLLLITQKKDNKTR